MQMQHPHSRVLAGITMLTGIHDGNRSNYGLGPAPDKDAFVVAVTALLEKPTPAMTTMKVPAL